MDRVAMVEQASLASRVSGPVFVPEEAGFEEEVASFNAAMQHRPAFVLGATGAEDVQEGVRWAAEHGLSVSVQATGHGALAPIEGGLLISTRRMQGLRIEPSDGAAWIEAGVKWRAVIDAAAPFGLAPTSGSSSDVGAIGYTVGGGLPILGRTFGFASDLVRSFDVVTADGRLRHASSESEHDLFWALRGGKLDVGIVTAMTIELVPAGTIYGGGIYFDGAHAPALLEAYRRWTPTLPDALTSAIALLRLPPMPEVPPPLQGRLTVHLIVAYVGDPAEGERLLQPMRDVAPAIIENVREMPYTESDTIHQDPAHPIPFAEAGRLLRDLTPEAIQALLSVAGPEAQSPLLMVEVRHLAGALGRSPRAPDSVGARDAAYSVFLLGALMPPIAAMVPGALAEGLARMAPFATGRSFVNLAGAPSSAEDRARTWPAEVYERLQTIKLELDPNQRFRFAYWGAGSSSPN